MGLAIKINQDWSFTAIVTCDICNVEITENELDNASIAFEDKDKPYTSKCLVFHHSHSLPHEVNAKLSRTVGLYEYIYNFRKNHCKRYMLDAMDNDDIRFRYIQ